MTQDAASALRAHARNVIFAAGGRGFVRFLPPGGELLVTDAVRRGDADTMGAALMRAGFSCVERGGLLEFSPSNAWIVDNLPEPGKRQIEWESSLYPAQALTDRFLRMACAPLTQAGRQLVLETLRLLWQPEDKLIAGLDGLKSRAAVMLRSHDTSGMFEAGAFLNDALNVSSSPFGKE